MDHHDRRRMRRVSRPDLDDMLRKAADIDEAAARPVRALDQARAHEGYEGRGAKDPDDDDESGHGVSLFPPRVPGRGE
jgi:hypothetical protein